MKYLLLILLLSGCGFGVSKAPDKPKLYRGEEIRLEINRARSNLVLFNNTFSFSKTKFNNGNVNLFHSLLCSIGEQWACNAIKDMQNNYNFICRSWEHCLKGKELLNAASRDEFTGRLLFWTTTKYYNNVPANNYITDGRICKTDSDGRCNVSIYQHRAIYDILNQLGRTKMVVPDAPTYTLLQAKSVPTGYQIHLQAVMVYLNKLHGTCKAVCIETTKVLIKRDPNNEFFQHLAGYHKVAVDLFLKHVKEMTYVKQTQFWQERDSKEKAWLSGNAANTIFLGELLSK